MLMCHERRINSGRDDNGTSNPRASQRVLLETELSWLTELMISPAPKALTAAVIPQPAPSYDGSKPTVAILLCNTHTEISIFCIGQTHAAHPSPAARRPK